MLCFDYLFIYLNHSLPYISKRPFLHEQNRLLSPETFRKGHPLPTASEKLNLIPPFLSELPQVDVFVQKLLTGSPQSVSSCGLGDCTLWLSGTGLMWLFGKKHIFCYRVGGPATKWQPNFCLWVK